MGNIAAATSIGGVTGKLVGRVGDVPIEGSGGYADNRMRESLQLATENPSWRLTSPDSC
jgi:isoaspartyl peptidase/L-asparaginase-like protein (Ntn-hydrolase superfamily)